MVSSHTVDTFNAYLLHVLSGFLLSFCLILEEISSTVLVTKLCNVIQRLIVSKCSVI